MNRFYNAVSTIVTPRVIRKKKEEVVFDCPAIDPSKDITEVSKEDIEAAKEEVAEKQEIEAEKNSEESAKEEVNEKQEIEVEETPENTPSEVEVSESKQQEETDLVVGGNKRSRIFKKQKNEQ